MSQAANKLHDIQAQQSLSVEAARKNIYAVLPQIEALESINIRQALGRYLGKPIISSLNVPAHTNSAVDGYALGYADIKAGQSNFKIIGTALAGHVFAKKIASGECIRITTGAVMPEDCDTVIMQEDVTVTDESMAIDPDHQSPVHRAGQHVRQAGEDLSIGETVFSPGRKLHAGDIGLIASLGIPEVFVKRRLRVAFFSTGDELRSLGQPLKQGDVYDSNRYILYSMLTDMDCDIIDMGVIPDQPDAIRSAFQQAAENADLVLTSGGVSVGDADYVKMILDELGEINFWKLNMKPGRPLAFGQLNGATFFGLPGNPVAVMVTFFQFVIPAIRKMMGAEDLDLLTINAISQNRLKKQPGRTEFQRGILSRNQDGEMVVQSSGSQGAGILSSVSRSNCLIILDESQATIEAGDRVAVQPYINFMR